MCKDCDDQGCDEGFVVTTLAEPPKLSKVLSRFDDNGAPVFDTREDAAAWRLTNVSPAVLAHTCIRRVHVRFVPEEVGK